MYGVKAFGRDLLCAEGWAVSVLLFGLAGYASIEIPFWRLVMTCFIGLCLHRWRRMEKKRQDGQYTDDVEDTDALLLITVWVVFVIVFAGYILFWGWGYPENSSQRVPAVAVPCAGLEYIPATATDISQTHSYGLGQSWEIRQVSFGDGPERIAVYEAMGRKRAEYVLSFERYGWKDAVDGRVTPAGDTVPRGDVVVTKEVLQDIMPWKQYFFLGRYIYQEKGEPFPQGATAYIWDSNKNWNHPKAKGLIVYPDRRRVVFFEWGGE